MIQVIFATGCLHNNKHAFGYEDKLPWPHIARDLDNFKSRTMGTTLVMTAGTFRSLPGKLVGRRHIVLSSSAEVISNKRGQQPDDVLDYTGWDSTEQLLKQLELYNGHLSIIGGKELILASIPVADRIIHSIVASTREFKNTVSFSKDELSFRTHRPLESHWYWLSDDRVDQPTYLTEVVYANPAKAN